MSSCLKPRQSHEELVQKFLQLLRVKGFSTKFPQKKMKERSMSGTYAKQLLKADLLERIDSFLERNGLVRSIDLEELGQLRLPMRLGERYIPLCHIMKRVAKREYPKPIERSEVISFDHVNVLTSCFACLFVKEGFSGMRNFTFLDDLRLIVADTLRDLGYSLEENQGNDVPRVFPDWTECNEWWCLAKKEGAPIRSVFNPQTKQLTIATTSW